MPGVDTKFVKYEVKDRVAWVTLNRPEAMNALSQGLLADLGTVFREVGRDDDVLVVILTGEGGRAFSAGADLKEMAARQAEQVASGAPRTIGPPDGAVSNPFDARQNVHAGARYLKFLMERFGHDVSLALAAYNAGEDAVERNGGQIPPFSETMAYVPRVLKIYKMLTEQPRAT